MRGQTNAPRMTIADFLVGDGMKAKHEGETNGPFFRIGDLAQEFGLTLRALRFYEDKGLLRPRRAGVTRLYNLNDYARLRLVIFGRRIGFTLGEISELIGLWEQGLADPGQLSALRQSFIAKLTELEKKKVEIDDTIDELRTVLGRLSSLPG
ncbi:MULTISPECIES: MerR family transcriptional regulator [Brucella]|uniref:Transcriptional regulator, MerR family n=7 Tax=Brucella TaxID=234 RepID=A0A0H3AU66_BRUO2|nr:MULTISPECIES: MerR family transcriptional regulator [Brucella]ABQ62399.1 transcriptional regulator, MerR family [Brucella ovis ATCC 25840]AHB00758.1 MerR family transcriptional regulator [Brucella ceti TE10759-12]AHB03183.1 MerR family transcriptional regulator [Brucella ceti TE28753-12]AIJ66862.1 merR regulatory family protein [Brucella suis]APY15621.1 MerR family transcriptional regulator [Brucella sp. 09RB8910]